MGRAERLIQCRVSCSPRGGSDGAENAVLPARVGVKLEPLARYAIGCRPLFGRRLRGGGLDPRDEPRPRPSRVVARADPHGKL